MTNESKADLLKIADARLHPSLRNPNYLVLRARRRILARWLNEIPGNDLIILDLGGRYQPYRPLIQNRVKRYVAFDKLPTVITDVVGEGERLPFRAESFDLVIATGVFEYFAQPHPVASQIYNILKPGGALILSVGAVSPRFVSEEHWRYMRAGLESVLSPFTKVEIVPEVSSIGGFLRLVNMSLDIFTRYGFVRALYRATLCPLINLAGLLLEGMKLTTNDQVTGNYSALARK